MLNRRKQKSWLKTVGLVLIGVAFSVKIKEIIGKYVPAVKDVLDKVE
jgi:hypothetical protein